MTDATPVNPLPPLLKMMIASGLRGVLHSFAGILIAGGAIEASRGEDFVALALGVGLWLAGLAWSFLEKRALKNRTLRQLLAAAGGARTLALLVMALPVSGLLLGGCATGDPASWARAINTADKGPCYQDLRASVTPMMLFGFVVPILSGTYVKICAGNGKVAPPADGLPVGRIVAPPPAALPAPAEDPASSQ